MNCDSKDPRAIRTAEKFPSRLEEVHQGRIVLRDDAVYHGAREPIDVVCTVCGHEWEPTPDRLVNHKTNCPECARQRKINSAGTLRCHRSTQEEKDRAKQMRADGMTYQAIAEALGRSIQAIANWCDPAQKEKDRQRTAEKHARNRASGKTQELTKAYNQTSHGRANMLKSSHKRRGLEFHCEEAIFIDGVSYENDLWAYVKGDQQGMEMMSFVGADEDVSFRKGQQEKLSRISGERYSLEHLIPLSRGGIHAPENFANRALELNLQKGNSRLEKDDILFCSRLFS